MPIVVGGKLQNFSCYGNQTYSPQSRKIDDIAIEVSVGIERLMVFTVYLCILQSVKP